MYKYLKFCLLVGTGMLFLLPGCDKNDQSKVPVNSFSMIVNGQSWEPTGSANDPCYGAYNCQWSALDGESFYNIVAIRESELESDKTGYTKIQLQIMGVTDDGLYPISESYGDFKSYARFTVYNSGNKKVYNNSTSKNNSKVIIDEMIRNSGSAFTGIKGTFSGILYKDDNPLDSVVVEDCKFTFKRINWGDNCQCDEKKN